MILFGQKGCLRYTKLYGGEREGLIHNRLMRLLTPIFPDIWENIGNIHISSTSSLGYSNQNQPSRGFRFFLINYGKY